MKYQPMRDLLLVKKVVDKQTAGGIVLPDAKRSRFVRLEVLDWGPHVATTYREKGLIVHAENMYQELNKEYGLILEQYIFAKEVKDGSTN